MSTSAWQDFAVPASPHFVLVDGATRRILGRGSAAGWEQISTLVADAEADSSLAQGRSSSDRAARAEQALAAAGIVAGHPSLYPSRSPGIGHRSLVNPTSERATDDRPRVRARRLRRGGLGRDPRGVVTLRAIDAREHHSAR